MSVTDKEAMEIAEAAIAKGMRRAIAEERERCIWIVREYHNLTTEELVARIREGK